MILFTARLSRSQRTVLVAASVCLIAIFACVILVAAHNEDSELPARAVATSNADASVKTKTLERFGRLPLSFERNDGQTDQSVKFVSRGPGYDLFLTATDAVLSLQKPVAFTKDSPATVNAESDTNVREGTVLRLKLLGAAATPRVEGQDELPGKVNYFIGNDQAQWRRDVPTFRRVQYKDVYPGIDEVYYGNQRELEYDFVVAPKANPKLIRFSIAGAEGIRLDQRGNLSLATKHGDVALHKPAIYQLTEAGERREVKGSYAIKGNEVSFKVQQFDGSKPLIIDPILSYSTYLGGAGADQAIGIAVDSQGNAYVAGLANRAFFPITPGAFKTTTEGNAAFVSKLDPTGSTLLYSTFLSGTGNSVGTSIAVDAAGNAHVAGYTFSPDFPAVNGLKTASNVFKTVDAAASWTNQNSGLVGSVTAVGVAPNAPNIVYAGTPNGLFRSTDSGATWAKSLLTGLSSSNPFINSLAVDPSNSAVVYAGTINGGLIRTTDGGNNATAVAVPSLFSSVFSIVFDPATPSTIYLGTGSGAFKSTDSGSTWVTQNNFGIVGFPIVRALAIDPVTPLTIYAGTQSSGLFKSTNGGGSWTAMNSGMGGASPTFVTAIAIDPANPATIYTGHGSSGVNKSTNAAASWTPVNNGVPNSAVTGIVATPAAVYAATSGAGLIKTTDGGNSWTSANAGLGSLTVNGIARNPADPATLYAAVNASNNPDAFVAKLNSSGSALLFSTLLGGSGDEFGNGIALDANGNIYVVGQTLSANFPTVNALQSAPVGAVTCFHGFLSKIDPSGPSYAFSTYLRGNGCDTASAVTTDAAGNVYLTGKTSSTDFPIASAFQSTVGDPFGGDVFITKLTTTGTMVFSTYLGGSGTDAGQGIAVDVANNVYVTGSTTSSNFPTANPIQATNGGSSGDAFVTKLNSSGSALVYSTYLGGSGIDLGRGIAVDANGNAYVTGTTDSFEFPITAGALRTRSGFYRTTDDGSSWSNENYGLFAPPSQLVVHPTQPSILYAGTSGGVFRSTNGGRNWTAINNGLDPNDPSVRALVIDPLSPSTVYVATGVVGGASNRVYKTTNGGDTWNQRSNGITFPYIGSLAIDPVTPATLYLGTIGGPLYKTTDGADNWAPFGNNAPSSTVSIAVDPLAPSTLYAADSSGGGFVYKSVDAGANWQHLSTGGQNPSASFVSVSPHTAGLVYARTNSGLFKSGDGGANWSLVRADGGTVVFDPIDAATLYLLSNTQGLLRSTDNGLTWIAINKGLDTPVAISLAFNPLSPSILYLTSATAGGQDSFVTRINPAGNALIYSTFLGGPISPNGPASRNAQAFGLTIDASSNVYVTGMTQSLGFAVTPNAYQPFNRGFADAFITKLSDSYIISGHVQDGSSAPVSGVDVVLNDGTSLTAVQTESDGSYEFSHLRPGGNFTVSATRAHFSVTPASQTFNNLNSNQVLDFTVSSSAAAFHTIGGQITENGIGLSGVTVTLSGSQPGLRVTDSNGNYSFELAAGGNYTVTPSLLGFNFGPASLSFNNLSAPQVANFPASRQSFVVTNANNHGAGSLREAIVNANATPGADSITFNIPGPGVKTIALLTPLPEITEQLSIDGTSQPGYAGAPLIELDGAASAGNGLVIKAGGSTVRGLSITNFHSDNAIWVTNCDNNVIQGNYLGLDPTGTTGRPNGQGILLSNSSNNVIGGTTAAARNVISGNISDGIEIGGNSNVVEGNFIGTNAAGTAEINNGQSGVTIPSSNFINNVIGGTAGGAGNLISGNQRGVDTSGTGTVIQGNLIGTGVTGTSAVANNIGVNARGTNILVGGLTPGARNIISGNGNGVTISGSGTKLQGNYIGTDITGTLPLGNTSTGVVAGENVLIGGLVPAARNIISANGGDGNVSLGSNNIGSAATVQGNYIGTDVTGTRALSNSGNIVVPGISVSDINHTIGGLVPGARNVISGNGIGIAVGLSNLSAGNVIQGNFIGLNADGTSPLPNNQQGVLLSQATNTTLGGTQAGAANKIAFNGGPGVQIVTGTGNALRGNSIFSNNGLGIDLAPNGSTGVTANDATDNDTGPNNLQNFPVLTSVLSTNNGTTVQGTLTSFANTTFQIDFYSSAALDPSGNGEGGQFLGSASLNTDNSGNATINANLPIALGAGRVVTATATDPNGNTSEFSAGDATNAAGSVQFSVSAFWVIEDVGMANITVQRTGGSVGNLSVDYSTADGTAIAGQDYTAVSGTLNFSGGETSKTIQVPIADDSTTEPDETFMLSLHNAANVEAVGAPSVVNVTIQDHNTIPFIAALDTGVTEGTGNSTDAVFTVILSAATGRSVSVNYATSNFGAFGGASCNDQGVDYESASGTITFQPGTTSFMLPIKVCGDKNAEANESFNVVFSNPVNADLIVGQALGTILNDDALILLLEDSSKNPNQAAAVDADLFLRDPFRVLGFPDKVPADPDPNTKIILFAQNLELNPGEASSAVVVRFVGSNNQTIDVQAIDVRNVREADQSGQRTSEFTQVKVRLPDNLSAGTCTVFIRAHGRSSNLGTIRIEQ